MRQFARRNVIAGASISLGMTVGAPRIALSQESSAPSDWMQLLRPEDDPQFGPVIRGAAPLGGAIVGTTPARHEEIRTGFKLLLDAPRQPDWMVVAGYFRDITSRNGDGELYNREWRVRANPVILGFFAATGTAPADGDQTSWCAAFVSFCLVVAGQPNRYTALSGGYRTFGTQVGEPQAGDIAVFALAGENGRRGFGHVGFFVRQERRGGVPGIILLGGNQVGTTRSTGAVTESWYSLAGQELLFHSIRRVPSA